MKVSLTAARLEIMSRVFQSDYTSEVKMYTLAANTNHSWSKQTQTRIVLATTGTNTSQ